MSKIDWIGLSSDFQLDEIYSSSETVVIFKHSTRCPISSMAKRNLEFDHQLIPQDTKFYYLDLIKYREISNTIALRWSVTHESPQILVIQGNSCLYHVSHADIDMRDVLAFIS